MCIINKQMKQGKNHHANCALLSVVQANPEQKSRSFPVISASPGNVCLAGQISLFSTLSFFPNNSMTVTPHFFYTQRFVPISPSKSIMQYEVYRNTTSPIEDFKNIDAIYKRVMKEDKFLCDLTQRNLASGIFVNGEMHPKMEKGPLYFQQRCREIVQEHWKKESIEKSEIWPARQRLPGDALMTGKDLDFCSGLACTTESKAQLAW